MLRDLHCHTLLKSSDSWDFLCLGVYGDVSANTWDGTLEGTLVLSLVPDPLLWSWLSGHSCCTSRSSKERQSVRRGHGENSWMLEWMQKCWKCQNKKGQLIYLLHYFICFFILIENLLQNSTIRSFVLFFLFCFESTLQQPQKQRNKKKKTHTAWMKLPREWLWQQIYQTIIADKIFCIQQADV